MVDANVVRALGHPLRVRILTILNHGGAASPKMLSEELGQSLGLVSYHVTDVLFEGCGVLELVGTKPRRGAVEHFYALKPGALLGEASWRRRAPAYLRSTVSGLALKTYYDLAVAGIEAGSIGEEDDTLFAWTQVAVDDIARREIEGLLSETLETAKEIAARARQRTSGPGTLHGFVVGVSNFAAPPDEGEADRG